MLNFKDLSHNGEKPLRSEIGKLPLQNGSKIAVIGAGPAGAFFT